MGTTQLSSLYPQIVHTVETSVAYPDPNPDPDPPDPHALCLLYTAHRPDGDHPALLPHTDETSVADPDPDPPDPHVFGPPGS
jgi:hypothetical protein